MKYQPGNSLLILPNTFLLQTNLSSYKIPSKSKKTKLPQLLLLLCCSSATFQSNLRASTSSDDSNTFSNRARPKHLYWPNGIENPAELKKRRIGLRTDANMAFVWYTTPTSTTQDCTLSQQLNYDLSIPSYSTNNICKQTAKRKLIMQLVERTLPKNQLAINSNRFPTCSQWLCHR